MRHHYGIGFERLIELYEACGGQCQICGVAGSIMDKPLHIDHCHDTQQVRGLLCGHCNRGIGLISDPALLRRAAAYLEGGD